MTMTTTTTATTNSSNNTTTVNNDSVKCQSQNCVNGHPPSKLECPTCSKLGIKGSFFCGQACFKAGCKFSDCFKTHKIVHDLIQNKAPNGGANADGTYDPFPNFAYTSPLRPCYPLSPKRPVPDHIPRPDYILHPRGVSINEQRAQGKPPRTLSPDEIEKMRVACKFGREILDLAASHIKPGITTDALDEIVHNATIERNAYPSPFGYREFPKSFCSSVNEVICHGIPDQRPLREGDIVNLDISLYYQGYHADLNATYPVGKIDDDSQMLINTTRKCLDEAIKICKPGALFRDVGKVIEPIAKAAGCSVVRTYVGHGINDLFHAPPNIPHYAKNKAMGTMKPGMTFTIEPMINRGLHQEVHWPDNWTATTVDGKRSAQFEETLLITETGVEILTAAEGAMKSFP